MRYTQVHTPATSAEPPPTITLHNPAYPSTRTAPTYLEGESDNMSNTYYKYSMETEEHEPWDFGDPPAKTPFNVAMAKADLFQ